METLYSGLDLKVVWYREKVMLVLPLSQREVEGHGLELSAFTSHHRGTTHFGWIIEVDNYFEVIAVATYGLISYRLFDMLFTALPCFRLQGII